MLSRHAGAAIGPVAQIILACAIFLALPAAAYVAIGTEMPGVLVYVHYAVATAYAFTAAVTLLEARLAIPRRQAPVSHQETLPSVPRTTVIISAYLPNEHKLIVDTVVHLCTAMRVPTSQLQIILAYNSPERLDIERDLGDLQALNASFLALHVPGSRSKAENIAAALEHADGEMTVLLDADHRPLPDAFERAYRWLQRGYDVVQGRCVVRNKRHGWFTRYIAVEFEQMYGISHTGRSLAIDTAIFGGSNGYWRTSALKQISMDPRLLTEDIDSSIRAMLAGYRIIHDRSIVSSELATTSLGPWWNQRLRWAQGWFQVTLRYQGAIWRSRALSPLTKLYWTYLLAWREMFPILSLQVFALLAAAAALGTPFSWFTDPYLLGTTVFTLVAGPVVAVATYRIALWRTRERLRWWFVIYALTSLPYVILKNFVALAAMVRELTGVRTWVVTARAARAAEAG